MAESAAQKRQRKLHDAVVAARTRKESPREDAAIEKVVTPSSTTSDSTPAATIATPTETKVTTETTAKSERIKSRERATTPAGSNFGKTWTRSLGPKPQAKVMQKHVLFALVSAFIINLIAQGKSLPVKGS